MILSTYELQVIVGKPLMTMDQARLVLYNFLRDFKKVDKPEILGNVIIGDFVKFERMITVACNFYLLHK